MRRTRRLTLFLMIAALVLSMSCIHVFADAETEAVSPETQAEEVIAAPAVDADSMTYEEAVALLDQIVCTHKGISGTGVFGEISADCNGTGHLLCGNDCGFRDIQEIYALGIGGTTQ